MVARLPGPVKRMAERMVAGQRHEITEWSERRSARDASSAVCMRAVPRTVRKYRTGYAPPTKQVPRREHAVVLAVLM